ncbi:ABC transporter substrate-binding protein [Mailhella sp.]
MKKSLTLLFLTLCLLFPGILPAGTAAPQLRLVAIGAPAVEILCALGLGDRLIARSSWERFPPFILDLPEVGSPYQPNLERLLLLKPDLVLLDGRLGSLAVQMERYGIETLSLEAYNPNEVIPAVRRLAERFDCEERGEELIGDLLRIAKATKNIAGSIPEEQKASGIMLTGLADQFCVAPESGCTLLEDAGTRNLAAGTGQPFPLISREWLACRAPDFLLVPEKNSSSSERKREAFRRKFSQLLSGQRLILFMEEEQTFGLRSFLGSYRLATELYPGSVQPDAFETMMNGFMNKYFPQVSDEEKAAP